MAHAWPRRVLRRWKLIALSALGCVVLLAIASGWYAWTVIGQYRDTRASIDQVRTLLPTEGSGKRLSPSQLPLLHARLLDTQQQLRRLDDRVHVPIVTSAARRLPYLGEKVQASEALIDFGVGVTELAVDSSQLATNVYQAYQSTGLTGEVDPNAPTWLTVVQANRQQIDALLARFDAIRDMRTTIDEQALPQRGRSMLAQIDPMLDRVQRARDQYAGLLDYYPVVEQALGADRDGRYLVLFLNSQELRQSGGFPGTYGIITVREGRLASYEFFSISDLDAAYVEARDEPIPAPAPIRQYLKQQEWLPRDSGWSAEFSDAANLLLTMYAITGEPPIAGVMAVSDRAVEAVLATVGPVTVTFEGAEIEVNDENVINTIEGYRAGGGERHKEAVKAIGTALMDRIKGAGFDVQGEIIRTVRDYADRREIQFYAVSPDLQREVVELGWDGALNPEVGTPTLGMTISNIVGNKASQNVYLSSTLEFDDAARSVTQVTWTIMLEHTGDPDGNLMYNGFHRTWLALYLPSNATEIRSSIEPAPPWLNDDPRANGYHIELLPGESETVQITFTMPTPQNLILRRQAGANDANVEITGRVGNCDIDASFTLWKDFRLSTSTCDVRPK